MKQILLTVFLASALLTGCARFAKGNAPAASKTATPAPTAVAATQDTTAAAPDLSAMTFVEKNNLYMQLLAERQAAGTDASAAEEAYLQSLQESFNGNDAAADRYLEEAILFLSNQ